jgi:5-methylcytosine-specific restriction endonuclease McrA
MGLVLLILICLFIWWLSSEGSSAHTPTPQQQRQARRGPTSPISTHPSQPDYGRSNSQEANVRRRPIGDWICGCNGVPLTHLPEYSIDYNKYKTCPTRHHRKRTGSYVNDAGQITEWRPRSTPSSQPPFTRKRSQKTKRVRPERSASLSRSRPSALERERKKLEAEAAQKQREKQALPAQGATEALRRGLDTYIGKECKLGHGGERYARNSECVECRRIGQRMRDAMRRGAYPRDLTPSEKRKIGQIYAEARRLTKETGIEHHVDHIKPLAAGGEHHPDNLRGITAEENLKKGANWNGVNHAKNQAKPPTESQGELPLRGYRNLGAGRKESLS